MKNVSLPLYLCTVIGTFKDKTVQIYKRASGEDTSENIAWNQEKTTTKKMKERFKDERKNEAGCIWLSYSSYTYFYRISASKYLCG